MKKVLFILIFNFIVLACSKYDDNWARQELSSIKDRIESLEKWCENMNSDIHSLKLIISAIEKRDYVETVTEIVEEGVVVGYQLTFGGGNTISIYNGEDGIDGNSPEISVRQDSDGIWYWTVNNEWLTDKNGHKIPTIGRDDLMPELKIEDGFWFISYDNGINWDKLSEATGEDGTSFFKDITQDENALYLTLNDGTIVSVPKKSELAIELAVESDIACEPFQTITIPYILKNAYDEAEIITISEGDWEAKVVKESAIEGKILVTAPEYVDTGKVVVVITDSGRTILKSLSFAKGLFSIENDFTLNKTEGKFGINLMTNYEYAVSVDCSWLRYLGTKATRIEELEFEYDELPSSIITRSGKITFTSPYTGEIKTIEVHQGDAITIDHTHLNLMQDEEFRLTAESKIEVMGLIWSSSDTSVATVDQNGLVTAISEGDAVITVSSTDNRYSASCNVSVMDITDYIYLKYYYSSNTSYSDGYVLKGTILCWKLFNNTDQDIMVKSLQIVDGYSGYASNIMSVNSILEANNATGWEITLGSAYRAPHCKVVFEYKGREYSHICGSAFN